MLKSVLGVQKVNFGSSQSAFETAASGAGSELLLFGTYDPAQTYLVIGFKYVGNYGAFFSISYSEIPLKKLCELNAGVWTWY